MSWAVTVAAIIEREGRFLMVEETDGVNPERVLNQPAGHVDPGESALAAVVRETREETGLAFEPRHLIGIYHLQARNGLDYLRICFSGTVPEGGVAAPQDPQILACHWLTREDILRRGPRSSVVLQCIDDYRSGRRLPLEAVSAFHRDR
jgi:8-oxo-dGTP pyrophosphatase MutT (NUDIX family)